MSDSTPRYIPRLDVPNYYPVSLRTIDEWIANRIIPVVRNGRRVILRASDIEAKFDSMTVNAAPRRGRPRKSAEKAKAQA